MIIENQIYNIFALLMFTALPYWFVYLESSTFWYGKLVFYKKNNALKSISVALRFPFSLLKKDLLKTNRTEAGEKIVYLFLFIAVIMGYFFVPLKVSQGSTMTFAFQAQMSSFLWVGFYSLMLLFFLITDWVQEKTIISTMVINNIFSMIGIIVIILITTITMVMTFGQSSLEQIVLSQELKYGFMKQPLLFVMYWFSIIGFKKSLENENIQRSLLKAMIKKFAQQSLYIILVLSMINLFLGGSLPFVNLENDIFNFISSMFSLSAKFALIILVNNFLMLSLPKILGKDFFKISTSFILPLIGLNLIVTILLLSHERLF